MVRISKHINTYSTDHGLVAVLLFFAGLKIQDQEINYCWCSGIPERKPVEVGSFASYVQGFVHSRWLFGISFRLSLSFLLRKIWGTNQWYTQGQQKKQRRPEKTEGFVEFSQRRFVRTWKSPWLQEISTKFGNRITCRVVGMQKTTNQTNQPNKQMYPLIHNIPTYFFSSLIYFLFLFPGTKKSIIDFLPFARDPRYLQKGWPGLPVSTLRKEWPPWSLHHTGGVIF